MPATLTYPGVYIEEIPSGVRTITGVATSITAFIGRTSLGPTNEPTVITSFGDFEQQFGGLTAGYPLSYSVRDFFVNGGSTGIIVRLASGAASASRPEIGLQAISPGTWANTMVYTVDSVGITADVAATFGLPQAALFNLTVYQNPGTGAVEKFLNVAVTSAAGSRRLDRVLTAQSNLVEVILNPDGTPNLPAARPADSTPAQDPSSPQKDPTKYNLFAGGADGGALADADYLGVEANQTGMYALAKADLFNLLCIPPDTRSGDTSAAVYSQAMAYCAQRRAMLIVDPPMAWGSIKETAAAAAIAGLPNLNLTGVAARNAALYFPRVIQSDPNMDGQLDTFVPCGIIAGIMSSTDSARGVWKAPAGLDAALGGVTALQVNLNDGDNGRLNPLGINCLRYFTPAGRVVWGARTLRGADQLADDYKYVPVRRLALYIEESLYRGTQWVVFEPNDTPLWAQIRLNVGAFMNTLFRQGAFQGQTPAAAYFVKCDSETTTQNDIDNGVVNIVVGFAPLKPAEFVVIQLQQIAGDIQS